MVLILILMAPHSELVSCQTYFHLLIPSVCCFLTSFHSILPFYDLNHDSLVLLTISFTAPICSINILDVRSNFPTCVHSNPVSSKNHLLTVGVICVLLCACVCMCVIWFFCQFIFKSFLDILISAKALFHEPLSSVFAFFVKIPYNFLYINFQSASLVRFSFLFYHFVIWKE